MLPSLRRAAISTTTVAMPRHSPCIGSTAAAAAARRITSTSTVAATATRLLRHLPTSSQRYQQQHRRLRGFSNSSITQNVTADGIVAEHRGTPDTLDYRVYFRNTADDAVVSPWHALALRAGTAPGAESGTVVDTFNYLNEIPLGSRAKLEVATTEAHNPIKQDIKKGALRYFTYGDIPFNYGCLPQTWEDPKHKDKDTGYLGDNDPIDVVELSDAAHPLAVGVVTPVKVLGCYALIDEGETDWKILAIATSHPLAPLMHDIEDIDTHMPGMLEEVFAWFRDYKTTDGKPQNTFAFDGRALGREYALGVVNETHAHWHRAPVNDEGSLLA